MSTACAFWMIKISTTTRPTKPAIRPARMLLIRVRASERTGGWGTDGGTGGGGGGGAEPLDEGGGSVVAEPCGGGLGVIGCCFFPEWTQGVGEPLTREAVRLASTAGARTVDLTSRPSREAASRLYERLGFRLRDTRAYRLADSSSDQAPRT